MLGGAIAGTPTATADNKRLNDGVVANVYTIQHQHGCDNDVKINPQLQLAAEWHANDVLNNRALDGDIGSDGSTPQTGPTPPDTRASSPRPSRSTRRWRSTASRS